MLMKGNFESLSLKILNGVLHCIKKIVILHCGTQKVTNAMRLNTTRVRPRRINPSYKRNRNNLNTSDPVIGSLKQPKHDHEDSDTVGLAIVRNYRNKKLNLILIII